MRGARLVREVALHRRRVDGEETLRMRVETATSARGCSLSFAGTQALDAELDDLRAECASRTTEEIDRGGGEASVELGVVRSTLGRARHVRRYVLVERAGRVEHLGGARGWVPRDGAGERRGRRPTADVVASLPVLLGPSAGLGLACLALEGSRESADARERDCLGALRVAGSYHSPYPPHSLSDFERAGSLRRELLEDGAFLALARPERWQSPLRRLVERSEPNLALEHPIRAAAPREFLCVESLRPAAAAGSADACWHVELALHARGSTRPLGRGIVRASLHDLLGAVRASVGRPLPARAESVLGVEYGTAPFLRIDSGAIRCSARS